jgi:putative ABC transport system permease protein
MWKNYLTIAWRTMQRNKAFTAINVIGLSTGMACAFLIVLFIYEEQRYDTFHQNYDRIYRLVYNPKFAGLPKPMVIAPPPAAPFIAADFPEVETTARLYRRNATVEILRASQSPVKFEETNFCFADSSLLKIFTFQFLEGNPETALNEPFGVVLTDETAKKYFADGAALGKTIRFAGTTDMRVTGIVKKFPNNSHIQFNAISNYETMFAVENPAARANLMQNWVITHSLTYVLLKPNESAESVNQKFPAFLLRHAPKQFSSQIDYALEPMRDFHLRSDTIGDTEAKGSMVTMYVFSGIALITLLIACINFINLSTARALKRAKEVGMRKALGAEKSQITGQFLGESVITSLIAFLFALVLTSLALPTFSELMNRKFSPNLLFTEPLVLVVFFAIAIAVGLLAGSYPAFFIAAFKPIETLKGNFASGKSRGGVLRHGLVVVQFAASIVLMIGSLVVLQQLRFLNTKPLGFEKEFIVVAGLQSENLNSIFQQPGAAFYERLKTLKTELKKNPSVQGVAFSNGALGQGVVQRGVVPEGKNQNDNLFIGCLAIDFDFIATYQLNILAGRGFSREFETDLKEGFLINETGAKSFGWLTPQDAVGKLIEREGKKGKIVGVVQDFHAQDLSQPIQGVLFDVLPNQYALVSFKLAPQNITETLRVIEQTWASLFPDKVFQYEFLDRVLAVMYDDQNRLGKTVSVFAALAILISCLGLYGLIALVTEQRVKEVGIRKVLGASLLQIIVLISQRFLWLIASAFLIAIPIAYYAADKWLNNFAFKIDIGVGVFLLAGLCVLMIAMLTMSFRTIKAAMQNPVKSLRYE